jgi:hypothetical protein
MNNGKIVRYGGETNYTMHWVVVNNYNLTTDMVEIYNPYVDDFQRVSWGDLFASNQAVLDTDLR